MEYVIFFILAGVAVFGALNTVLRKNPVIAALHLVLCILALAGIYLGLNAEFLAAVQVVVYAGAIMVFFLFVVILINLDRDAWEDFSLFRLPAPVLGALFALVLVIALWNVETSAPENLVVTPNPGSGKEVGWLLFREWSFPFEIASLILFVGMVGAIVLAKKRGVD